MSQETAWFHTSPEAVLQAESILNAFHDGRIEDIAAILANTYDDPLRIVVALVCMADRLADYADYLTDDADYRALVRTAAAVVAQAHYETNGEN